MSARDTGDPSPLARYEAIVRHAELELELASRGEVDGLTALGPRWDELVATLPDEPPAAAAVLLERATLIHERTGIELIRLRDAVLGDLATSTRARRTAEGYAGRLTARPRLNRSA